LSARTIPYAHLQQGQEIHTYNARTSTHSGTLQGRREVTGSKLPQSRRVRNRTIYLGLGTRSQRTFTVFSIVCYVAGIVPVKILSSRAPGASHFIRICSFAPSPTLGEDLRSQIRSSVGSDKGVGGMRKRPGENRFDVGRGCDEPGFVVFILGVDFAAPCRSPSLGCSYEERNVAPPQQVGGINSRYQRRSRDYIPFRGLDQAISTIPLARKSRTTYIY